MENYEQQLKMQRDYLKRLEEKDPETVYHCPICNEDVLRYQYDLPKQGMCNKCFNKKQNLELQRKAEQLVGATIINVAVRKMSDRMLPYGGMDTHDQAHITKLVVKLKDGTVIKLNEEERAPALLF